jgi:S-disulfanyl-L-cysteine oxidoreductase SoxD
MSTFKPLSAASLFAFIVGSSVALAQSPGVGAPDLGKPLSEADIKAWDITILPDGSNLPPGSGTVAQGTKLFVEKGCVACHGEGGKGGPNAAMATDEKLDRIEANKTIGNFWGYSTPVFDFIRRAMPYPSPRTLNNDEVYALAAYVLYLNKLIGENDVMNAQTLPKVKMPNRDNFIIKFPDKI